MLIIRNTDGQEVLQKKVYHNIIVETKIVIRVTSTFRTTSTAALQLIAGGLSTIEQQRHRCGMDQAVNPESGTLAELQLQKSRLPSHTGPEWPWYYQLIRSPVW